MYVLQTYKQNTIATAASFKMRSPKREEGMMMPSTFMSKELQVWFSQLSQLFSYIEKRTVTTRDLSTLANNFLFLPY